MDRDKLERLARSETYMHRLTRDDLADIVRMLDEKDETVRSADTRHAAEASSLVSEVRRAARHILDTVDAVADNLERTR